MRNRGVTLIMVAGVLSVLAALGAGFYSIAVSQSRSSTRYNDSIRAEMMARSGIYDAMARLREGAYYKIEDPSDPWYMVDYLHGGARRISFPYINSKLTDSTGKPLVNSFTRSLSSSTEPYSDQFALEITDASSKININACDNLGVLLDNLCRVIGPPLVAADPDRLQPAVWASQTVIGVGTNPLYKTNPDDKASQGACYYMPTLSDQLRVDVSQPPLTGATGAAAYGDGYAIARYRAHYGKFNSIVDVKAALTVVKQLQHPELETLERELKFDAIKDYITIDSWVDTNTVCTGKFEWINKDVAIDRDKSWIEDDQVNDPLNKRGSLRGCYMAIVNGHAAGTLRRIKTNGADWVQLDVGFLRSQTLNRTVEPGPLSSYMIITKEDAKTQKIATNVEVPVEDANGNLVDDPNIDYNEYPLCIHRAPININTASDKVLTALFLGINVTHGHYQGIGTDVDVDKTYNAWYSSDPHKTESRISTLQGLKRIPVSSGRIIFDKPFKTASTAVPRPPTDGILPKLALGYNVDYLNNYGASSPKGDGNVTEAHDLALRIIMARQSPVDPSTGQPKPGADPYNQLNSQNKAHYAYKYLTGPFKSWDDFYFRVVQPWDLQRYEYDSKRGHAAPLIMAHFNSNTDLLKFNPGIEWIDRWGRNFSEMEPLMAYEGQDPIWAAVHDSQYNTDIAMYIIRNMRYKADEMIDKTDINRGTTEFCFDSGGIFEIKSTGRVMKGGQAIAERRMEALVQLYDVWRETTQRQFCAGVISEAANPVGTDGKLENFRYSGKPVRDSKDHGGARLALDTLPEPLVPLKYRLSAAAQSRNKDVVDTNAPSGRDCWGNPKVGSQNGVPNTPPDVIANHVMPASYDGQIVLATNIARYGETNEEMDTFLASFNGDLDTDTSVGNGREQAKSPADRTTRVLDTCGLLGVLGDTDERHIDYDMQDATKAPYNTFRLAGFSRGLQPLDPANYWENVLLRQGDLRAEGVWLGYVGCSGNDGTLKYLVDVSGTTRKNFDPEDPRGGTNGATICMWFKPNWHGDDNHYHEFFNADNPGNDAAARYFQLLKGGGQPSDPDANDLTASFEDHRDTDSQGSLFGGSVTDQTSRSKNNPAFRIQPFRWGFVGGVYKYNVTIGAGNDYSGYNKTTGGDPRNNAVLTQMVRPFINTQKDPEGSRWSSNWFWSRLNDTGFQYCDIGIPDPGVGFNQQAAWDWADGGGGSAALPVFGANNLNKAPNMWLYRYTPIDGTMAVIDEYKLTKSMWTPDLISKVMATSRYYLPKDPNDKSQCPFFTSQSLLQSLRGFNTTKSSIEQLRPIRVAWNCFTPRFMHQSFPNLNPLGAPFDYLKYNAGLLDANTEDAIADKFGVNRPTLNDYLQMGVPAHATRGVEIELLNGTAPIPGEYEKTPGQWTQTSTFIDSNVMNRFKQDVKSVRTQDLHYVVRFRYPIDPSFGGGTVDPNTQYMLDTPVFDDISITYTITPRILMFKDISE